MKISSYIIIVTALIFSAISTSLTYSENIPDRYQREHAKGYWFYDDPEKKIEKLPLEIPPRTESVIDLNPPEIKESPTEPPKEQPIKLTVEWIKENAPKYRRLAIDDPTPENVRAYLYLQRLMMDKSQRYADAVQKVLLTDPLLDENTRRPTSGFGGTQANTEAEKVMTALFDRLSKRAGLWFFFRQEEMGMNNIQAGVLEALERTTGIQVFAISMDGASLPNNQYPNAKQDQGHSKQLQIIQTPAMFLVRPGTKQITPVAQAAMALPDLKRRILLAATTADWITEDDFHATRGMRAELTIDSTPTLKQSTLDDPQRVADELEKLLLKRMNHEL